MINRVALVIKYKEPAVEWINKVDPHKDDAGLTIEIVNTDNHIYLISEELADDPKGLKKWLKKNYKKIFELELDGWYTDPSLWPKKRKFELFNEFFEVELHSILIDTVDGPIVDEDL